MLAAAKPDLWALALKSTQRDTLTLEDAELGHVQITDSFIDAGAARVRLQVPCVAGSKGGLGISLSSSGRIRHISSSSPAAQDGLLHKGDTVIAVDGRLLGSQTLAEALSPSVKEHTLIIHRKDSRLVDAVLRVPPASLANCLVAELLRAQIPAPPQGAKIGLSVNHYNGIDYVVPASVASRDGTLQPGDLAVEMDGASLSDASLSDVLATAPLAARGCTLTVVRLPTTAQTAARIRANRVARRLRKSKPIEVKTHAKTASGANSNWREYREALASAAGDESVARLVLKQRMRTLHAAATMLAAVFKGLRARRQTQHAFVCVRRIQTAALARAVVVEEEREAKAQRSAFLIQSTFRGRQARLKMAMRRRAAMRIQRTMTARSLRLMNTAAEKRSGGGGGDGSSGGFGIAKRLSLTGRLFSSDSLSSQSGTASSVGHTRAADLTPADLASAMLHDPLLQATFMREAGADKVADRAELFELALHQLQAIGRQRGEPDQPIKNATSARRFVAALLSRRRQTRPLDWNDMRSLLHELVIRGPANQRDANVDHNSLLVPEAAAIKAHVASVRLARRQLREEQHRRLHQPPPLATAPSVAAQKSSASAGGGGFGAGPQPIFPTELKGVGAGTDIASLSVEAVRSRCEAHAAVSARVRFEVEQAAERDKPPPTRSPRRELMNSVHTRGRKLSTNISDGSKSIMWRPGSRSPGQGRLAKADVEID